MLLHPVYRPSLLCDCYWSLTGIKLIQLCNIYIHVHSHTYLKPSCVTGSVDISCVYGVFSSTLNQVSNQYHVSAKLLTALNVGWDKPWIFSTKIIRDHSHGDDFTYEWTIWVRVHSYIEASYTNKHNILWIFTSYIPIYQPVIVIILSNITI